MKDATVPTSAPQHWQALLDLAPILVRDLHGRVLGWGGGLERLYGWSPREAVGRPASELLHTAYPRPSEDVNAELRRRGLWEGEVGQRARDGRPLTVALRAALHVTPDGPPVVHELHQDVTPPRRELALVVDNSSEFVALWDPDGRPLYQNPAGLALVGHPDRDAMLRAPLRDYLFPEDHAFLLHDFLPRVLRGGHGEVETRFRHFATGEPIWVALSAHALRDEHGRPTGLATLARNLTDRRRTEARLRRKNERLRLLNEAAAHLLVARDPDELVRGLFERLRPHLAVDAYLHFTRDDPDDPAAGLRLASFAGLPDDAAPTLADPAFVAAVHGRALRHRQPEVIARIHESDDPALAPLRAQGFRSCACSPLVAGDRLLGTLAFASRRRDRFDDDEAGFLRTLALYATAAHERLHLIGRLRDADKKKDEFLATLAHELRNPLAPIRNAAALLRLAGPSGPALHTARDVIDRQVTHMVRLVDDLLDVGRITRGKLQLRPERVDLAAVVRTAVETARPLLDAAGHTLTVTLPDDPVPLDADPVRLAQVFANLLTNAAKYTDPGGEVALAAAVAGGEVVVRVRDTGIGLSPADLARVFEMFAQVAPARERSQGGLGIGLALVKGLVAMHGGTVEAASDGPGRGSTFTVRLPLPAVGR